MFVKLAILACCLAAATAVWNGPLAGGVPASQFPAGVSPQACPNYPNCNNPALAANPSAPAQQWGGQNQWNNPAPQWNNPAPQWNAAPQWNPSQNALDRGEYVGDGDYHGEGLAESGAYGNNGGGQQGGGWNAPAYNQAPAYNTASNGIPAQIPAGVDAGSCPNYPFCH